MLQLLQFFSGPFGKITAYIAAGAILIIVIFIAVKTHDNNIRAEALNAWNKLQLEEIVKNQKETLDKLKKIEELNNTIQSEMIQKNKDIDDKLSSIDLYLNKPSTVKQDRKASNILKDTIKSLGNQK